jgi:NAD(P)-dependent dehydrogenase (short-subunit alcohol dehydrogenase family)
MFDLTGKVALITGSTRGIGRSMAENMAKAGAKVVISSRHADECEKVAAELRSAGHDALGIAADVGNRDALERLVARTLARRSRIDVLACNAATNTHFGPIAQASDEAFDKMMTVNVKSVWQLCTLVAPQMAERKDGAIIITSSIAAFMGNPVIGLYGLGKSAINALVRNLATEWGPSNIRVNGIAPGLVRTEFARALWSDDKIRTTREAATPLRRIGEPDDIGGIAVMLASRAGAFITGQVIVADGGITIV